MGSIPAPDLKPEAALHLIYNLIMLTQTLTFILEGELTVTAQVASSTLQKKTFPLFTLSLPAF